MKFNKGQILKNVGSSWFSLGVNVVVGLFLSPFILHRLGDEAFGLWILIFSVTGYYGLFDLGIRSSIVRYVAKYSATDEHDELNKLVNTAMFSYGGIGVVAMLITLIATYYVNSIFRIPAEFVVTARWLLLMVGASVSLGFPLGVFSGILEGLQRFYLLNFVNITSTVLRAVLIVVALRRGGGLLTVALITVALPLLNQACEFHCRVSPFASPAGDTIHQPGKFAPDCRIQRHDVSDHRGWPPSIQDRCSGDRHIRFGSGNYLLHDRFTPG